MSKGKEIPFSPEWMINMQEGLTEIDPLEFLIALEEIELRMKTENVEVNIQIKKVNNQ